MSICLCTGVESNDVAADGLAGTSLEWGESPEESEIQGATMPADASVPRRLPCGLAVSVIGGMSLGLWVGIWKLATLAL
jgi:hypothetical protein